MQQIEKVYKLPFPQKFSCEAAQYWAKFHGTVYHSITLDRALLSAWSMGFKSIIPQLKHSHEIGAWRPIFTKR